MATGATVAAGAAFLKRMYSPRFVVNTIAKKESRMFNQIRFLTDGAGDSYNFPNMYADNPSGSASFTEAQERSSAAMSAAAQFNVPYYDEFSLFSVTGGLIARTRNKEGAWLKALKNETDSALRTSMHRKSVHFYTSGWGELGQMSNAAGASPTLTLNKKSYVYRFYKNMKLCFSASLNGAALRTGRAVVLGVDYNAGTLTLDQNTNAVTGLAQNDWIFTNGDRQDSATPVKQVYTGLGGDPGNSFAGAGWIPVVKPTGGESFFGQDRSTNSFLYGNIIDLTTNPMPYIQALTVGAQTASSIGHAEKLVAVCSPNNFTQIAASIQGQKQYVDVAGRGGVMFRTLSIFADGIEMALMSDMYCPDEVMYGGDPGTIEFVSCGPAPALDDNDGRELIKQSADNGVEGRWCSYETAVARNPAAWFVVRTGSTT